MKPVVEVRDLGIRFPWKADRRRTLKKALGDVLRLRRKRPGRKWVWALRNVEFDIYRGETLGIIGRNGSGKTTLLRTIAGIYRPDEGEINVRATVSPLLSLGTGFQQELSGIDNIYINGVLLGFSEREIEKVLDDIVNFAELGDFIDAPVKTYSSGMTARLGFSIAVHLRRDVMLIDEILGVGDARFRKKSEEKLKELIYDDGRTVVLVSHSLNSVKRMANRAIWIDGGTIKSVGDPETVINEYLSSS